MRLPVRSVQNRATRNRNLASQSFSVITLMITVRTGIHSLSLTSVYEDGQFSVKKMFSPSIKK